MLADGIGAGHAVEYGERMPALRAGKSIVTGVANVFAGTFVCFHREHAVRVPPTPHDQKASHAEIAAGK